MSGAFLQDEDEVNILGLASFFSMGQNYGTNEYGDPYYRIMHPHLIKNKTKR